MSFDFIESDAELEALLKSSLPGDWRIQDAANGSASNTLAPILTYLQTDVSTEWEGTGRLADGYFAVSFVLDLAVPEKDLMKAGKRLMLLLPVLFRALDSFADVEWSAAQKAVGDNGIVFYSIPITALTHITEE